MRVGHPCVVESFGYSRNPDAYSSTYSEVFLLVRMYVFAKYAAVTEPHEPSWLLHCCPTGLEWAPERFAGTLMGDYTNKDTRAYKLILEPEKLPGMFTEVLDEYNVSFPTQMHLVFFKDAIAHLSRIARILRQVC